MRVLFVFWMAGWLAGWLPPLVALIGILSWKHQSKVASVYTKVRHTYRYLHSVQITAYNLHVVPHQIQSKLIHLYRYAAAGNKINHD